MYHTTILSHFPCGVSVPREALVSFKVSHGFVENFMKCEGSVISHEHKNLFASVSYSVTYKALWQGIIVIDSFLVIKLPVIHKSPNP